MYTIEPPLIQVGHDRRPPLPQPTLHICRLNPPQLLVTPEGPRLQQQQVFPYMSCWQWREAGTLPGGAFSEHFPSDTSPSIKI